MYLAASIEIVSVWNWEVATTMAGDDGQDSGIQVK